METLRCMVQDHPTPLELAGKNREELRLLRASLVEEMSVIRGHLAKARMRRAVEGVSADRDWYRKAQVALDIKGRQVQHVDAYLTALKEQHRAGAPARREEDRQKRQTFYRVFLEVTRERLTGADYAEICREAERRLDSNVGSLETEGGSEPKATPAKDSDPPLA